MLERVDWPSLLIGVGVALGLLSALRGLLAASRARRERPISSDSETVDLARLRARLLHAERLAIVGELAAATAHEIKNPLAPIRGYAQMLSERLDRVEASDRPIFERGLRIIREESDRIDQRIATLLDRARGERPADATQASLDLNRVLAEATTLLEGEPGAPRIRMKLDPSIGRVVGIEDEIRGAVVNLLKNAIETTAAPDADIEVVTRQEGGRAIVEILDQGPGLETDAAERAFEVFFTTKKGGTGLGLAIARSAIESAGGTITLAARSDRMGAVARIELDLAPPSKAES